MRLGALPLSYGTPFDETKQEPKPNIKFVFQALSFYILKCLWVLLISVPKRVKVKPRARKACTTKCAKKTLTTAYIFILGKRFCGKVSVMVVGRASDKKSGNIKRP